jgi:hypothetical protein
MPKTSANCVCIAANASTPKRSSTPAGMPAAIATGIRFTSRSNMPLAPTAMISRPVTTNAPMGRRYAGVRGACAAILRATPASLMRYPGQESARQKRIGCNGRQRVPLRRGFSLRSAGYAASNPRQVGLSPHPFRFDPFCRADS